MGIAIRLKEVSFKYDGAKENVLENINLTVEYGETVLLLGVSGEGKSTLLSIINGVIPFVNSGEFSGSVEIARQQMGCSQPSTMRRTLHMADYIHYITWYTVYSAKTGEVVAEIGRASCRERV